MKIALIKTTIKDKDALASLSPTKIKKFLIKHGWILLEESDGLYSIWKKPDRDLEPHEVMVPNKSSVRDYPPRVSDIIQVLEVTEKRTQTDIFFEMRSGLPAALFSKPWWLLLILFVAYGVVLVQATGASGLLGAIAIFTAFLAGWVTQ